jgi:hypothetical protein
MHEACKGHSTTLKLFPRGLFKTCTRKRSWKVHLARAIVPECNKKPRGPIVEQTSRCRGPRSEQWFLIATGDDEKAKETISRTAKGGNEIVEVISNGLKR